MAEAAPQSKSYGLTNQVSNESEHFKPEAGRYHLYIAHACPFALRAHLALRLKGLEDIITLSVVHPITEKTKPEVDDHVGWVFRKPDDEPLKTLEGKGSYSCRGCVPDTINNAKTVRELYEISGNAPTVYSVPILWDKKLKTVVNNESAQLIRIFNSGFSDLAKNPTLDLYPEALRTKIDETNNWILSDFDGKIFKTAQAQNQKDYEENANAVFAFLDKLEEILSKSRYLVGDQITEADVRLFPNLVRFDEAYHVIFKLNKKRIVDYPNILNYLRDFYQTPGIAQTVDMEHIKISTFNKFPLLNPYGIIPIGPDFVGELKQKHNREKH